MKYSIAAFTVGWVHLVHWVSEACLWLWDQIKMWQHALLWAPFLQRFKKSEAHGTICLMLHCSLVPKCLYFSFFESNTFGSYSHSLLYFPEGSSELFSIRCGGCPLKQRGWGHRGGLAVSPCAHVGKRWVYIMPLLLSALNGSVFHRPSVRLWQLWSTELPEGLSKLKLKPPKVSFWNMKL